MTTFEFFKAQLDEAVAKGYTDQINPEIKPGTYRWVKVCSEWFFGGAWDYQMKDVTDLKEMLDQKLLKVREYSNWQNRMLGQTRHISLTVKGVRAFYQTIIQK